MKRIQLGQLLLGMLAFFLSCGTFAAGAAGDQAAAFVGGVTHTITHSLHNLSFALGLICVFLAVERFKKYRNAPGEVSLSAGLFYLVFGVILIGIYFC